MNRWTIVASILIFTIVSFLNPALNYPRINEFPEWFTIEEELKYKLVFPGKKQPESYTGVQLVEGIPLILPAGRQLSVFVKTKFK